ncbi:hypothetical protein ACPXCE_19845 [Streptomyces sp. DT24]|uniref:hypothetical protein n=1 Tax=unclassified Streptomyces TaxID=2593676 RepID=UPI0023BA00E1|nr:hypothetical protein [Streptomyces sp. AM 4-1-1]WEH33219.1 hypothetical protein PZB75_07395 [Streptomyces sp. AM 4-1-1]
MTPNADAVRHWAETVLRQLRAPRGHTLTVTPADPQGVEVTLGCPDGTSTSVLLERGMAEAEAVVMLAGQLQDGVLESTGGAPAPPCPASGHSHPAVAAVVDGVASWTCPQGGGTRPVLPPPAAA